MVEYGASNSGVCFFEVWMKEYFLKFLLLIPVLCLIVSPVAAQGAWNNYTNANCINDIAIEGDYIWCATTGGVVRWDRRDGSYVKYTSADGLSHNAVNCVAVGPDNVKWFGTGYGVSCFDANNWTRLVLSDGVGREYERNRIRALTIDHHGAIWAGSTTISHYDGESWDFYNDFPSVLGVINSMIVDGDGAIWVDTGQDCFCYDDESWKMYTVNGELLLADSDNVKWFVWKNDIITFNGENWITRNGEGPWPIEDSVTAMAEGPDKLIWFATNGSGIYSWDGENWLNFTEANGLPSNDVTAIAVDEDNVVWAGTEYGLASYDGTEWHIRLTSDLLGDNDVSAIAVDSNDTKWFVSSHIGIFTYDNLEWNVLENDYGVYAGKYGIAVDHENSVWIGFKRYSAYTLTEPRLFNPHSYIRSIAVDNDNIIWFGTEENGVYRYDGVSVENVTITDGLASNAVYAVAVDSENVKWFGVSGAISQFNGVSWTTYSERYSRAIAVDADNVKWFGGPKILNYDNVSWTEYDDEAVGLPVLSVISIAVDHNNVKWFGTEDRGVLRFDGTTWNRYTAADGLGSNQVNGIAVDQDNVVWFATSNGITSVDADTLPLTVASSHNDVPATVVITGNYPNPFNPTTTIEYTLDTDSTMAIDIYNISGQHVKTLFAGQAVAGVHNTLWNGQDKTGKVVSAGIYLCRIQADNTMVVHRMTLVK